MARWRSAAIELLPELREIIASAENIMALWVELLVKFQRAYDEPRNEDLIARIYAYADWCLGAPRNNAAEHDPSTAVMLCLYEHIPQNPGAYEDMPRWFRYEEIAGSKAIFSYLIGEGPFNELLEHMKKNRHRYVPRKR